jgi:hypothetical protein
LEGKQSQSWKRDLNELTSVVLEAFWLCETHFDDDVRDDLKSYLVGIAATSQDDPKATKVQ